MTARDVMTRDLRTVDPELTLVDLERRFIEHRVSGFPVVRSGLLLGMVSRSDIVRQLCVEQSLAESISDYYREMEERSDPEGSLEEIAERVGQRIEHLRVKDVMMRRIIDVRPDQSVREVARILVDHRVHRVPVVENHRLAGMITSLDLVRLISEGETGM